jgi:hypothetical protein
MIAFIQAHEVMCAGLGVALLDLVFALIPSVESNGVAHSIYLFLKGLVAPAAK